MEPVVINRAKPHPKPKGAGKRKDVVEQGPENNTYARYDSNVQFANITPKVNVVRVKDDTTNVGVAKGSLIAEVPVVVPKNDAGSTVHAMKKRCDYAPQAKTMEHFDRGHAALMQKVPVMDTIVITEGMFEEYIKQYTPEKGRRLAEAVGSHQLNYDGNTAHVFAKQEVLLKEHGSQPRVIYQSTDMHNALAGVICTELNRRMKQVFSKSNPLNTGNVMVYACGLRNEEIGDLIEADPGDVLENDMKNNDGSQSVHFRRREAMMYAKLGAPKWFVREFAKNTSINVWTRYGVAATVHGQMWSGRNNTTTGNSYVGMALMLCSLLDADITKSTNIHGGDDYLGIVQQGKVPALKESIEKIVPSAGMTPEVLVPPTREHATFYRKRYVRGNDRTRGVPQFGRVVAKLNLRANANSQVGDREYMAGKYLSAAYEHRYVPKIADYLKEVSSQMSDKPHLDLNTNREVGNMDSMRIHSLIEDAKPLSENEMSGFLADVYGLGLDELLAVYQDVANSCIDYLNGWTFVTKGREARKPGFSPKYLDGVAVAALRRVDLGY